MVPPFAICAAARTKIRASLDKKSKDAVLDDFDKNGQPKSWIAKQFHEALGDSTASYHNFIRNGKDNIPPVEMSKCENKTYYRAYVLFG